MLTLVSAELDKLRTVRSAKILFAIAVLMPLGIAAIILSATKHLDTAPSDIAALAGLCGILIAVALAVGVAGEYQHKTIATAYTLVPDRKRVIVAKTVAAVIAATIAALVLAALSLGMAAIWLNGSDVAWPWTSGQTLQTVAGIVAVVTTMAVAGAGFGAIARASGGAVTLVFTVYLVLDAMLGALVGFWRDYGIDAAQTALTDIGAVSHYSYAGALTVNVAVALLVLAIGTAIVQRTDV
jgi:ABC-2 type transport system permease protein